MEVSEFIENTIDEIEEVKRDKQFDLDQLFSKTEELQRQINLLDLKQEVYRTYLKNERSFIKNEN